MTRLIDADALKKKFPRDSDWEYPVNTNEYVCEVIDAQPTVDATPAIRCKDCKFYRQKIDMCDEPYSTAHNVVHEDDFCSKAERKEE